MNGEFILGNWDWAAIFTGCAVAVSLIALWLQRRDLKKQAKYQRDTFELQNIIDANKTILQLIVDVSSIATDQVNVLNSLPEKIYYKGLYHKKYNNASGNGSIYYSNFIGNQKKVDELRQEFAESQKLILGKIELISILTVPKYYSKSIIGYLTELFEFFDTQYNETKRFDIKNSGIEKEKQISKKITLWKSNMFNESMTVKDKVLKEARKIQDKTEEEKAKLL